MTSRYGLDLHDRESRILTFCATSANRFASDDAQRHLKEGLFRRLLLIQTNRIEIERIAKAERRDNLSPYECADLNVHLNSFYFQMRGALDNLSWILHYELKLYGNSTEDDLKIRRKCFLFNTEFRNLVREQLPALAEFIDSKIPWAKDFKELRDPVAHRVPLYAIPGVVFGWEEEQFRELEREAVEAVQYGDLESYHAKQIEASMVGRYKPIFVCSGPSGLQLRNIHSQIDTDHDAFLATCDVVLNIVAEHTA